MGVGLWREDKPGLYPREKLGNGLEIQQTALDHWIPDPGNPKVGVRSERDTNVPKTTFTHFYIFPRGGCVFRSEHLLFK